ncbi:MAG: hypothetical protein KatS3mg131_2750 [Candidatus Tectimicrobiota bacterium]|nr:MAG: hypothetical protein KatS3mg131_2750 [Candidatus Tectomicrobia bacterium]
MQLLYDMPIGIGEPHYAQIIKADKLPAWEVYPDIGWDPQRQAKDPNAALPGKERVERRGKTVEIWMTAIRSHFTPERIEVQKGRSRHLAHHQHRAGQGRHARLCPARLRHQPEHRAGETATFEFDADQDGVFSFYCTEFCSALHLEMTGYLLVKPTDQSAQVLPNR